MKRRPQIGDEWEVKLPNKTKKIVKIIGRTYRRYGTSTDDRGRTRTRRWWVEWKRLPKGRYSGISVRNLLRHGKLLITKLDRDAQFNGMIERARQKRKDAALSAP